MTRYRYGDEQHLEEALKRIFRYGQVPYRFSELVAFVLDHDESSLSLCSNSRIYSELVKGMICIYFFKILGVKVAS